MKQRKTEKTLKKASRQNATNDTLQVSIAHHAKNYDCRDKFGMRKEWNELEPRRADAGIEYRASQVYGDSSE